MFGDRPQDRPNVQLEREFDRPLSPRERRAIARASRIASRGAAARKQKEAARQALAAKIRSGEYVSPADIKKAQAAGVNFGTRGIVGKTVQNLIENVEYAPAGIYGIGKAVALDTRDIVQHPASHGHFKRTTEVGKAIGESTVESVRHPLRRPGDTLLLALGAYGAAAGGVSRIAAAGRALEEGGARAALTRAGHEGGSILHRPVPGPRIHTVGGLPVRGRYSASAGIRALQRGKDRVMEGQSGLGEAATIRRAGKEMGQNRRVQIAAKRGPANRLARMGKRLTKPQQMALRLWGQGLTVDEKIAQHTRELARVAASDMSDVAKARRTRDLNHRIALAEAARPYMDGNDLASSFVVPRKRNGRRGATPKEMRSLARQAERVAGSRPGGREAALFDAGLIEPGQAEFRVNAPGRLALGAKWTTAAEHAVQQLSDIEAERTAIRKQDELRQAPTLDAEEALGGPIRERDYGNVEKKTTIPEQRVPGQIDDAGIARLAELDRQEQLAFEELNRGNEMTLTGAEGHRGRIRVPDVPTRQQRQAFVGGGVYRGGIPKQPASLRKGYMGALEESGNYQVNTTRNIALSALEAHHYTNVLELRQQVLAAGVRQRPADTRLVQWVPVRERALTDKQRRQLRDAGPVDEHEAALEIAGGEKARVNQEARRWAAFLEDIFPEEELAGTPVGAEVKNVVWVPRQLLANMNKPFARSPMAGAVAVVDTALNLVKFGIIPLKVAYVTANAAGNMLFNLVQQGVFLPRNWRMATKLLRDERTGPVLREIMGSGGMQALVGGNPKGIGVLNAGMHAYANVLSEAMLEPMMRLSSFYHEAARFGYKSPAQVYRLLVDPKLQGDLIEISRRGKDAIVDYDRMGPLEKAVVRRALFIYPWVKGATVYGGQFLLEHPVQSGVYGAIGSAGFEQAKQDLGPTPSWAAGTFKVGGTEDMPLVVNPSTISPFSQAAEILATGAGAVGITPNGGGSVGQLGGLLHPGIQAAIEAGYRRDLFTGAPLQGSFQSLLVGRSLRQTAPQALLEGLAKADQPPGRRAFPMTKAQVIERSTIGSFAPRTANRQALNEAARKEMEANLTPAQRARRRTFRERQTVFETMKTHDPQLLVGGRLPAPVRQAYNREAEVEAVRAKARQDARGDSDIYYRQVAVDEAKLLERWGAVPKGFARDVAAQVAGASPEVVKRGVQKMRDDLMPGAYRDITSAGRKYLERRGG